MVIYSYKILMKLDNLNARNIDFEEVLKISCNVLVHVEKKPFSAGKRRCVVLLTLALVLLLLPKYVLRAIIFWSNKAQAFKARKLWHFYFNKACSCKILMCIHCEVLPHWPHDCYREY